MTAEIDGDFVVFMIGMRINKPWKIHKWIPVFLAMPSILKELDAHPESGCLGTINSFGEYETMYSGMPPYGLDAAGKLVPATVARESARERFAPGANAELATHSAKDDAMMRARRPN